MKWIVCQIGAREHYAVARALHRIGRLEALITDLWCPPDSWLARLPIGQKLRDRWHADLHDATVFAPNVAMLTFAMQARLRRLTKWALIEARNAYFQQAAIRLLKTNQFSHGSCILFSYSYAAGELFRVARQHHWRTVLGQIDPGPEEERIVEEERQAHSRLQPVSSVAPAIYWQKWRQECAAADQIVVNSEWSRRALVKEGIPGGRMVTIPLSFADSRATPIRSYPDRFSIERPLRVLFLGQINLRKGVARLLEAARQLQNEPVEFWMAGSLQIEMSDELAALKNVIWKGAVPRSETEALYREVDVFLFPTLSDGFGLTQLEARAQGLPVIATARCGDVVRHDVDGWILPEPSSSEIVQIIRTCLASPKLLARWSAAISSARSFDLGTLGESLLALERTGITVSTVAV